MIRYHEFLDWLPTHKEEPFFAFLNYFDAHDPYLAPQDGRARLESKPSRDHARKSSFLRNWHKVDKSSLSPSDLKLVRNALRRLPEFARP